MIKVILSVTIVLLLVLLFKFYLYLRPKSLKAGVYAPDFRAKDDQGKLRTLSEFKGKKLVLYFYPKDDTPTCTLQAECLRDMDQDFKEADISVLGVSYDSPVSHKNFREKYNLPFNLLSDEDKKIAESYGAQSPLGNITSKRVTFLIDENGKIVEVLENFDVKLHAQEILNYFKKV